MNVSQVPTRPDVLAIALEQARGSMARAARTRFALYVFFGLATVAGFAVVAQVVAAQGMSALGVAWPALLAQLGGAALLVALLRRQSLRVRALRRRALPVREAVRGELADIVSRRRESVALLAFAAAAIPALLLAVQRLAASGAIDAAGARWLALACVLPGVVIAAVHVPRLRALRARRGELELLARELD